MLHKAIVDVRSSTSCLAASMSDLDPGEALGLQARSGGELAEQTQRGAPRGQRSHSSSERGSRDSNVGFGGDTHSKTDVDAHAVCVAWDVDVNATKMSKPSHAASRRSIRPPPMRSGPGHRDTTASTTLKSDARPFAIFPELLRFLPSAQYFSHSAYNSRNLPTASALGSSSCRNPAVMGVSLIDIQRDCKTPQLPKTFWHY